MKKLANKTSTAKTELERCLILLMAADERDQKAIRLFLEALYYQQPEAQAAMFGKS